MPSDPAETDPTTPAPDHLDTAIGGDELGGSMRLERALQTLTTDARADEESRARSRRRWLRRQAEEDSSVDGVLCDLAERESRVMLQVASGRQHVGVIRAVASDFCSLRADTGHDVLVRTCAVEYVRQLAGPAVPGTDRGRPGGQAFEVAVASLAEDQPEVTAATMCGERLRGRVIAVGRDVVRLELEGRGGTAYVPLEALAEVTVLG